MLGHLDEALHSAYDLAVLDLDGVVYIGGEAVAGAVESLANAREAGMRLAFVTNNASRRPAQVVEQLCAMGVDCDDEDVVTSAQAAARLLAEQLDEGATVFLVGGEGLEAALHERGLRFVRETEDDIAGVVQGYGPDVPWRDVLTGAVLVRSGLPWVASNRDMTIPTRHGVGPGNGTLVQLIEEFAEREPQVAGKPATALFEETRRRVVGEHPLVVGDRLDTDIEGARNIGWDSLLVLTGVTDLAWLVAAPKHQRPTYIGIDLGALADVQPEVVEADNGWQVRGYSARVDQGRLVVEENPEEAGKDGGEDADWWRAAAVAAWDHLDTTGDVVDVRDVRPIGSAAR